MAYFAKLDENNVVIEVNSVNNIEILNSEGQESEQLGVAFLTRWSGGYNRWKQTSYNTVGGVHLKGGTPFRKNYAGITFTYDAQRDAFIPPKPFPSWILEESTCLWDAPSSKPQDDKDYKWDEDTLSWIEDLNFLDAK